MRILFLSPPFTTRTSPFFRMSREYGTAIEKERHAQALQLWKSFPTMPAEGQKEAELEIHAVIDSKESIDVALSSLSDTSEARSLFMDNLSPTKQTDGKVQLPSSSPEPSISGFSVSGLSSPSGDDPRPASV